MPSESRRRGSASGKDRRNARPTDDATPVMAARVILMEPGTALDDIAGQAVFGQTGTALTDGLSTTWEGAQRLAERLTNLGCYLETQIHLDRCLCRVLRVLKGNAIAKQLACADAPEFPEALAKATILACLEMAPVGE